MALPTIAPLIHFAGITLGMLLALLLWTSARGNRAANRWLGGFVASLALTSVGDLLEDSRWVLEVPQLAHTTDWLIFAIGPCLWVYVRRLTMNPKPRGWVLAVHFIPTALCLLILVPFYLSSTSVKQDIVAKELANGPQKFDLVIAIAAIQIVSYWFASLWTLLTFRSQLTAQFSAIEARSFLWLRWMLAVSIGMWLLWLVGLSQHKSWAIWLDIIAVPLGLYVLAFLGLRQPAVFVGDHALVDLSQAPAAATVDSQPPASAPRPLEAAPRYVRSGLDKERASTYVARLKEFMELEKPWLENDLTLPQLAERIGITPHYLSQILNADIGETFFDFINKRRVAEVQRCLADPAYASQTLLEIGLAAGFNSKAAFNAAFKKHAGLTPSKFRESLPKPPPRDPLPGATGPAPPPSPASG